MWMIARDACERLRRRIAEGDPAVLPAARQLAAQAEAVCRGAALAVTDKTLTPHSPSDDPHDYVSIGTYWWPNPDTPDGLPYICQDGLLSGDFHLYDRPRWDLAAAGMVTTARAAYFLDDARYAREAVRRIRRWFLDPETRMTPHLRYAQMIPGRRTGGPIGIIDFALYLPALLEHVSLLAGLPRSPWTVEDQHGLAEWCRAFLDWLTTDDFGIAEQGMANNHGTYFDRLATILALYLDQPERAISTLNGIPARIAAQIEPNGSMPHELRRTCSFGYALMNTQGFVDLATIGRALDIELFTWMTADGRGIKGAVDFLYRFACSHGAWPHPQIEPIDWRMVGALARKANALAGDDAYPLAAMAHRLPPDFNAHAFLLLEPLHPFGAERSPAMAGHHEEANTGSM